MPLYCYTNDRGETIEKSFPIARAPKTIRRQGDVYWRDLAAEHRGFRDTPKNWPLVSDALGVHPDQIATASADARSKGVSVEFTPDGSAKFTSRRQWRDYCRAYGFYAKNAGYGDPAPR